jgi:hypothetical protein
MEMNFITGMTRAGMGFLANILEQNPQVTVHRNTPIYNVVNNVIEQTHMQGGYRHQCSTETRKNIISGILDVYNDNEVNFDVNYKWTFNSAMAEQYGKIICCVRNVTDILNLYEYDVYNNPYDNVNSGNVYSRAQGHLEGKLGESYTGIKQLLSVSSDNVMVVDYDILCKNPKLVIDTIYQFIGMEKFNHTLDMKPSNKKMILPPDLVQQYNGLEVWK